MKKAIIISIPIVAIIGLTSLYLYKRRPYVGYSKIDFLNKKVDYKISVNGHRLEGTKDFSDKKTTSEKYGKYDLIASAEGDGFVLAISENGKIIKGLKINLKTQDITKI